MTKRLRLLVLVALGQLGLFAGPVEKIELVSVRESDVLPAPLERGLSTYAAFMELAGPIWLLEVPVATFDSAFHYAGEANPPAPTIDPLAEDPVLVPEPRSAALLGLALAILLLLGVRRRRRTHSHNL